MKPLIALALPGGGARAAYQAGVLRGISDICSFQESPFQIITGVSAGAINGMWLASGAADFTMATEMMNDNWKNLSVDDVYKTDATTLLAIGAKWLRNLSLGDVFGKSRINYLLDTAPLRKLLTEKLELINRTVSILTPEQIRHDVDNLRKIPVLTIRPSRDLSCIGTKQFKNFPFTIRHMLKGLGVTDREGWDLLSYLAFDRVYGAALLELGHADALVKRKEITEFFQI